MPLGDVWKVRTVCYTPSQIAINDLLYINNGTVGGTEPTADQYASALDLIVAPLYKALMTANSSYRGLSWQLQVRPLPQAVFTSFSDGVGTNSGNMSPTQVSYVIGKETAFAGRRYRGRIYPGFVPAVFVTAAGNLTTSGLTALTALASALVANLVVIGTNPGEGTITFVPVLRSLALPGPPPSYAYYHLTSTTARSKIGTQRRRGNYGRLNILPF
jgi:hypothetical protein